MDRIPQSSEVRPVLAAAAFFLCTGLSIAALFVKMGLGEVTVGYWPALTALASPLVFLCACVMVFFRARLGYILGGIAALCALPWFVLTESSGLPSTWTYLNGPDEYVGINRSLAILKILSVALIAASATCFLLRSLFSGLSLPSSPLSRRTWPLVAVAVLVLLVWLAHSASPWMLPTIVDAVSPDLRILHIDKRGPQFHETSISCLRDGRFRVSHNDRRLLQYAFQERSIDGMMPPIIHERASDLARSIRLRNLRTAAPKALRSWNAEGWYVALEASPLLLAFTSEYGTNPPREVRDLLERIEKLPGTQRAITIQDVCMGFCYDPVAGLGFWYSNQRCHTLEDGTTRCL